MEKIYLCTKNLLLYIHVNYILVIRTQTRVHYVQKRKMKSAKNEKLCRQNSISYDEIVELSTCRRGVKSMVKWVAFIIFWNEFAHSLPTCILGNMTNIIPDIIAKCSMIVRCTFIFYLS